MDIFFVNNILLLITLSRNIDLTSTIHLPTHKYRGIFKDFWCIYVIYLKCGFKISTVHADGEFAPVREIISKISSGPMVNLTSANKYVLKTEQIVWVGKERRRDDRHSLTFMRLPVILTINIVFKNVNILVYFLITSGI